MTEDKRPAVWLGSTKKDIGKLPSDVKDVFVQGLYEASLGEEPYGSKTLKGFGGRSVIELREDHKGDTFRAVYTVKFKKALYVLHVFQKKSKKGIATPKKDMALVEKRLKDAAFHYKENFCWRWL